MIFFFNLCVVFSGLTLPGYLLARLFRLEQAWAVAFPLSALLIVEAIIGFSITGIPICFSAMAATLLCCAALCYGLKILIPSALPKYPTSSSNSSLPSGSAMAVLAIALVTLLIMGYRTTAFPLRGFDTTFRWEGLALEMLQRQTLNFYPPVSGSDYTIYLYPDGIPPLVSSVYWWIYAAMGEPLAKVTSLSIVLQFASTMALTFFGTRHAFGSRAAWFALLVVCTSPLLLTNFAIGQETGFTALSVAGQLCYAWATVRNPRVSTVVITALFAALGALSRDYGPALALTGFAVLAWHQHTRRYLSIFILLATTLSAPWYLRSWALTGNPFYSHPIPGGFAVNPVHVQIMQTYKEILSFSRLSPSILTSLFEKILTGGFIAICVGLPYIIARWRNSVPLLTTTLLIILLWIYSVGQTAGGFVYSTRVLTPAVVILAISSGAAFDSIYCSKYLNRLILRTVFMLVLTLLSFYSLASLALYPFPSQYLFSANTSSVSGSIQQELANGLQRSELPATGVLTGDLSFAESLRKTTRFKPILYWNPDVAFLFDPVLGLQEKHRRLSDKNIRLLAVDRASINNSFLAKFDFYRERGDWEVVSLIPDEAAVFSLPPM